MAQVVPSAACSRVADRYRSGGGCTSTVLTIEKDCRFELEYSADTLLSATATRLLELEPDHLVLRASTVKILWRDHEDREEALVRPPSSRVGW